MPRLRADGSALSRGPARFEADLREVPASASPSGAGRSAAGGVSDTSCTPEEILLRHASVGEALCFVPVAGLGA